LFQLPIRRREKGEKGGGREREKKKGGGVIRENPKILEKYCGREKGKGGERERRGEGVSVKVLRGLIKMLVFGRQDEEKEGTRGEKEGNPKFPWGLVCNSLRTADTGEGRKEEGSTLFCPIRVEKIIPSGRREGKRRREENVYFFSVY